MESMRREMNIPDWMILDSFRYALGRRSYQVGITTAWLIANIDSISDNILALIRKELDEELTCDLEARERGDEYYPLGHDMDRAEWVKLFVEFGNKQIKKVNT